MEAYNLGSSGELGLVMTQPRPLYIYGWRNNVYFPASGDPVSIIILVVDFSPARGALDVMLRACVEMLSGVSIMRLLVWDHTLVHSRHSLLYPSSNPAATAFQLAHIPPETTPPP